VNGVTRLVLAAVVLSLPVCTEPEPLIVGEYGGRRLGVLAGKDSAQFTFPCSFVVRTGALRVDAAGVARVEALLRGYSQPMKVEAVRRGRETLEVTVIFANEPPMVYQLRLKQPADFSDVWCILA